MDSFIEVFVMIADPNTNVITTRELETYVRKNNLDPTMIRKWKELFDPDHTGQITLQRFCDTLGIRPAQVEAYRRMSQRRGNLSSDVIVISQHMSIDDQIAISNEARRMMTQRGVKDIDELGRLMKLYLEQTYGPAWHVVVSRGHYAVRCRHLSQKSFHFRLHDVGYSVWQTPDGGR